MSKKVKILLTNDDGFPALGIHHLYNALKKKYKVTVVAPEEEQSGIGHAFTYLKPILFRKRIFQNRNVGYSVSGTPADCVKLAIGNILSEKPDIIISGINYGNNTGIAGYYSGTIAAAREGAFWQIPSIAFSVGEKAEDFFTEYACISCTLLEKLIIFNEIYNDKNHIFYSVNFPSCRPNECAGFKITRQSLAFYNDSYTPVKKKCGRVEYWLNGEMKDLELSNEYDTRAVKNNYISITPLQIDATALDSIASLFDLEKTL